MPLKAIEGYVVLKVNNEIITNIDLSTEYRYLIALNNELKKLSNDRIIIVAKNSLIREKIKKNELENLVSSINVKIVKSFYEKGNHGVILEKV